MIRKATATAFFFLLLLAGSLAAQTPAELKLRIDRSTSATDPDDGSPVRISEASRGFQVTTGPAAAVWNPANTATGRYTLKGTFTLQGLSSHPNYYGLIFGGRELDGANQTYLYFMVAQDGTYMIKSRQGTGTRELRGATAHAAVVKPNSAGKSVNALEVQVGAEEVSFLVNGTQVHAMPKNQLAATDGVWGVRVNHVIPGVLVENLAVTR
jgi:hypothetical protein